MFRRHIRRLVQVVFVGFLIGVFELSYFPLASASTNPVILTKFISVTGSNWEGLAHGGYGSGFILYYLPNRDISHPSLVVRISRAPRSPDSTADIYDAPNGYNYVPVSLNSAQLVSSKVLPAIEIHALGGWWFKNGIANYNLHIQINKPMYCMWQEPTYANNLPTNEPLFTVETRSDSEGNPLWDWRTLLAPLSNQLRTDYSQRESNSPISRIPSVSPLFPYIAYQGAFEQPNGSLVPPVVVDWTNARIIAFSEIVTVRHQNASYAFYSMSQMNKGVVNKPDFESPWGLYDLSGQGKGYPNLIIRTEHWSALDPYSIGIDQTFPSAPLMDYPSDELRYSWADHPGNQLFDYKVDVFGFHPYNHVQTIAGGALKVIAPAYADYPNWVIHNAWDSITFVDTNGGGYPTSEGIYDWTARNIGNTYWRGWTTLPDLSQYQSIGKGLRGEYEIGISQQPLLYLSPVDNRLHLENAQGGLWDLGNGLQVEEYNLNQGHYIDAWKVTQKQKVISQFYQISGYLIEADPHMVKIQKSNLPESVRTVLPPTDHSTWVHFSTLASHLKGKSPLNLVSWIRDASGNPIKIPMAALLSLRTQPNGFQMVLKVAAARPVTPDVVNKLHLPARYGNFVVTYDTNLGRWSSRYATPANPKTSVILDEVHHTAKIQIANEGDKNFAAQINISIDGVTYKMPELRLEGGQTQNASVPLYPRSRPTNVDVWTGKTLLYQHVFPSETYQRPSIARIMSLSVPNEGMGLYGLCTVLALFILGVFCLSYQQSRDQQS